MPIKQVSVILINYNSSNFTIQCIKSIVEKVRVDLSYEVIIIDNNSKIDDFHTLDNFIANLEFKTNFRLIRSKINLGFSGGNMLGANFANSEFLFFLNNDTELINDTVGILYDFMIKNPNVVLSTGQMYNTNGSEHTSFGFIPTFKIKFLGLKFLNKVNPIKYPIRSKSYNSPLKVELVTGAAMFFRTEIFNQIGGFDTNYFLYCEEEDIAQKISKTEYDIFVVPEAKFTHHTGKSTKRNIEIEKENLISLMYYFRKNYSYLGYWCWKLYYFIKFIFKTRKDIIYFKLAFFILFNAKLHN